MNRSLLYALLVFVAGSSYGFIVPVVKIASSAGIDVNDFLPLQYLVASIAMAVFYFARGGRIEGKASLWKLAAVGVLTSGCSLCYYRAVSLLPSAAALTLLFQFVWIGTVLDCVANRRLPSGITAASIAVVLAGTLFAAGVFEGSFSSLDPAGVAFGLASAVFYSLFLFVSGRLGDSQPVALRTMMLSIGGTLVTSAVNPAFYTDALFDPGIWPFAAIMSVLGIILPTSLISYASPHLTPGMVSIMASSELPLGVLSAWVLIGDAPSPLTLFGVILVLGGIVLNQIPSLIATAPLAKRSKSRRNAS